MLRINIILFKRLSSKPNVDMWKVNQKVTVSAYNEHKYIVKKCQNECHRIIGVTQRAKFKEAKENLPEDCYLFNEESTDISRA